MDILPVESEFHVIGDTLFRCMVSPHTANGLQVTIARGLCAILFVTLTVVVDILVQIVHATKEYGTCSVRITQAKAASLIAIVCTIARLKVDSTTYAVFLLQHHVHCIFLILYVTPQKLALWCPLIKYLHVLHRIVWQVLKHNLVLALEEVSTIQRQVLNLLAVDEYFAIILQLHTRQLFDESVEHGTLRHIEGIGIEDNGIALIHHLYLRGLDDNLLQRTTFLVVVTALDALHANAWHLEVTITGDVLDFVGHIGSLVVRMRGFDDILRWLSWYLHIVLRGLETAVTVANLCRVD